MLLSFKNALKFAFSPTNWFVSFIWSTFNIIIFLSFIKVIKDNFETIMYAYWGDIDSINKIITFLKGLTTGYILYVLVSFTVIVYLLIAAKRLVYNQSDHISLNFFLQKCSVLVPIFSIFSILFIGWSFLCARYHLGKFPLFSGWLVFSYILTAFLIAYMHHFNWRSLKKMFIPALCEPFLILTAWFYTALYGTVIYYSIKYIALITRLILKETLPLVLPCSSLIAFLVLIVVFFVVRCIFKALAKKAQVIGVLSLVYIIPSIILYYLFKSLGSINFFMFITVFQILWYEWLLVTALSNSFWCFMAHLFSESSLRLSEAVE